MMSFFIAQCSFLGVLWEDSQQHLRGRADSPFGEVWKDLGAETDDGSHDWSQQVKSHLRSNL